MEAKPLIYTLRNIKKSSTRFKAGEHDAKSDRIDQLIPI